MHKVAARLMQAHGQAFLHFHEYHSRHYFMEDEIVMNHEYVH